MRERYDKVDALKRSYRLQIMFNAEELAILDALRQCGPCFKGASWRRVMKQSEAHVRSISGF